VRTLPICLLLALLLPAAAFADGNVTTTQTVDTITIQGDGAGNDYDVKHGTDAMGNDVLVIEGKNNTTINGEAKFEIRLNPGATRFTKVDVQFSGGGDDVTVDLSGIPEDRRLEELEVSSDTNGTTTIKNAQMTSGGKINVDTGGTVNVESSDAMSLNITGESGTVVVKDCNIEKKVKVETKDADVTIQDSFFGDAKIKGGSKVNVQNRLRFRVQRSTAGKVSFGSGPGDDEVAFEDSTVEQVSAKLGDGDDQISFTGTTADKVSVDGGPGELDCLDQSGGGNVFGSFKEKGFEPLECLGVELEFFAPGSNPFVEPPENAVAWKVQNGGHEDGPFALPGAENPFGLPVLDPAALPLPAHWGQGPECVSGPTQLHHVHDAFDGHADPDEKGCGHGILSWGELVPVM
jgi:hypothetical protein